MKVIKLVYAVLRQEEIYAVWGYVVWMDSTWTVDIAQTDEYSTVNIAQLRLKGPACKIEVKGIYWQKMNIK